MRVLVTIQDDAAHLRDMRPVVAALQRAGHTVAVAVPPRLGDLAGAYGLEYFQAGGSWIGALVERMDGDTSAEQGFAPILAQIHAAEPIFMDLMVGDPAVEVAESILRAGWGADLVVSDSMEFGGSLAAERLEIPWVRYGNACFVPEYFSPEKLARTLNRSREALGLPPDPTGSSPYRYLYASLMTREFDPDLELIPNVCSYQYIRLADDDWLTEFAAAMTSDVPSIFVSLNSLSYAHYHGLQREALNQMRAVIESLGGLDCTAVVSLGNGVDPEGFGELPDHVRLYESVPQRTVLAHADLFITHAGYSSVREAIEALVPMVTVPLIGDARYVARRAAERGVAVNLSELEISVPQIQKACSAVLEGRDSYLHELRWQRRRMLDQPGLDQFVADLEAIVGDHRV